MIEILSSGAVNTVQDEGRTGYLDIGVGRSGAMDLPALQIANLMVGNPTTAAAIEVALFPFRIRFHAPTVVAITGADCPVMLDEMPLPPWWAIDVPAGAVLSIGLPRHGARAIVAFAGGIDCPQLMGSRATDLKSGFGGFHGRGLMRGDKLALLPACARAPEIEGGYGIDPSFITGMTVQTGAAIMLRVMPGAEHPAFTDEARDLFYSAAWTVTADANRMGYRLSGPTLSLERKLELFSHGIMPGTVQVPPSGQPIVQLAEANTCGGYPKITHVIEADLWRFAQAPAGATLRFEPIARDDAIEASRRQRAAIDAIARQIAILRRD